MMTTLIRIETLIATAVIQGQGAHSARSIARAWLKQGFHMGGGRTATVSVGVVGGRWHKVGLVGNQTSNSMWTNWS